MIFCFVLKCVLYKIIKGHIPTLFMGHKHSYFLFMVCDGMYKSKAVNSQFVLSCTWVLLIIIIIKLVFILYNSNILYSIVYIQCQ